MAVAVVVLLALAGGGAYAVQQSRASAAAEERADRAAAAAAAEKKAEEEAAAAEAARVAAQERAEAQELREARGVLKGCQQQLRGFYDALAAIDARLDVGVTQDEFLTYVGDASVAYDRIRIPALGDGACLSAAVKMETAFNEYSSTASQWNDCITDFYCDTDDITPGMQTKWAKASNLIGQSMKLVQTMNPDHTAYDPQAAGSLN